MPTWRTTRSTCTSTCGPTELVDRLRARTRPPFLRGWTLHTDGEPPYDVDPSATTPGAGRRRPRAGVGTACVSLSAPLGIEALPRRGRRAADRGLAPRRRRAARPLPAPGPRSRRPTPTSRGCAGSSATPGTSASSCPATAAAHAGGLGARGARRSRWPRRADVAGPRPPRARCPAPRWTATSPAGGRRWSATRPSSRRLVGLAAPCPDGRSSRASGCVFAAAAGLAPVHHERHVLRGGTDQPVDPDVYVDSSGYGPRALDAVVRVLGIDALVLGSDRPYAEPLAELFGEAATHAIRVTNPARLLGAATRAAGEDSMAVRELTWVDKADGARPTATWPPRSCRRSPPTSPRTPRSGPTTSPSTPTSGSTSRCTATTTSTSGCCAGPPRTTPAGTTTTSPPARSRSWPASWSRTT